MPDARVVAKMQTPHGVLLLHLETDDGVFRVAVEPHVWNRVRLESTLVVPDGDLGHPQVAAGITWPW